MPEPTPSVSVIVGAYNEHLSIEGVIADLRTTLAAAGRRYEILIVDDGSSDGTEKIADRLAESEGPVRVVHHATNMGLGGVYRTGFREARCDWVTFYPADGQFAGAEMLHFLAAMETADMVLGYLPNQHRSLLGKALSRLERILYRGLFGPMPRFQGLMMFRRAILDGTKLKSDGRGWGIVMELILRAGRAGYRQVSVPHEMRPRLHGFSKVNNARTIWVNLKQALALRRCLNSARR